MPSSNILNNARTNTDIQIKKLIVWYVIRMTKKIYITLCKLYCIAYKEERNHITHIQQPYRESVEDILGHFLFDKEGIEENKKLIFAIWKIRHQMKFIIISTIVRFNQKLTFSCAW